PASIFRRSPLKTSSAKSSRGKEGTSAFHPLHKPGHPLRCHFDLVQASRKAATQITFAAGPKRAARHARHLLLLKQFHREFLRVEAGGLDAGKGVERTARQVAAQAHRVERRDDEIAAQTVLFAHRGGIGSAVLN